jgi:hypothetical protein
VGEIFHTHSDWLWGASRLHNGYRVCFLEVKQPVRDVDHPSPSNAKVKERTDLYLYFPLWAFVVSSRANFIHIVPLLFIYLVQDIVSS